jgi:hypothetical protein
VNSAEDALDELAEQPSIIEEQDVIIPMADQPNIPQMRVVN